MLCDSARIPLQRIKRCEYLQDKRQGCRFDIEGPDLLLQLDGDTVHEAKKWVRNINTAKKVRQRYIEEIMSQETAEDKVAGHKWSQLQKQFFFLLFGFPIEDAIDNDSEERKLGGLTRLDSMKKDFGTDANTLRYIVKNVLAPLTSLEESGSELAGLKSVARQISGGVSTGAGVVQHSPSFSSTFGPNRSMSDLSIADVEVFGEYVPPPPLAKQKSAILSLTPDERSSRFNNATKQFERTLVKKAAQDDQKSPSQSQQVNEDENNVDHSSRGAAVDLRILRGIRDPDFVRAVLDVFSKPDTDAHGLAITTLWFLDPLKFASFIEIYASAERFSMPVKHALFIILLKKEYEIINSLETALTVGFHTPVVNPPIWEAVFQCLCNCPFPIREKTLGDCNSLLINSKHNCTSLQQFDKWQWMIFNTLTDIPKEKGENQAQLLTVFGYSINIIVLVHWEHFFNKPEIDKALYDTLDQLKAFSGHNSDSQNIGRIILTSIVNKLTGERGKFAREDFLEELEWMNFINLIKVIRKFVFKTAYWNDPTHEQSAKRYLATIQNRRKSLTRDIGEDDIKKLRMIEKHRMAMEEQGKMFMLYRSRNADEFSMNSRAPQDHYGIHFDAEGAAADVDLANRTAKLFKALGLSDFDRESRPHITDSDKEFLLWAEDEYHFWNDAKTFLSPFERQQIDKGKLLSYRKLSFVVSDFLKTKDIAAREKVLNSVSQILNCPRLTVSTGGQHQLTRSISARGVQQGKHDDLEKPSLKRSATSNSGTRSKRQLGSRMSRRERMKALMNEDDESMLPPPPPEEVPPPPPAQNDDGDDDIPPPPARPVSSLASVKEVAEDAAEDDDIPPPPAPSSSQSLGSSVAGAGGVVSTGTAAQTNQAQKVESAAVGSSSQSQVAEEDPDLPPLPDVLPPVPVGLPSPPQQSPVESSADEQDDEDDNVDLPPMPPTPAAGNTDEVEEDDGDDDPPLPPNPTGPSEPEKSSSTDDFFKNRRKMLGFGSKGSSDSASSANSSSGNAIRPPPRAPPPASAGKRDKKSLLAKLTAAESRVKSPSTSGSGGSKKSKITPPPKAGAPASPLPSSSSSSTPASTPASTPSAAIVAGVPSASKPAVAAKPTGSGESSKANPNAASGGIADAKETKQAPVGTLSEKPKTAGQPHSSRQPSLAEELRDNVSSVASVSANSSSKSAAKSVQAKEEEENLDELVVNPLSSQVSESNEGQPDADADAVTGGEALDDDEEEKTLVVGQVSKKSLKGDSKAVEESNESETANRESELPSSSSAEEDAKLWAELVDKKGRTYYYNKETKVTQWKRPVCLVDTNSEVAMWKVCVDPNSQRTYYYNRVTKVTTWTKPECLTSGVAKKSSESAESAALQSLPANWSQHVDKKGRTYYHNSATKATQWTRPVEDDTVEDSSEKEATDTAVTTAASSSSKPTSNTSSAGEPAIASSSSSVWTEHVDKRNGRKYYFNSETQKTQWTAPLGWDQVAKQKETESKQVSAATITGGSESAEEEKKERDPPAPWKVYEDSRTNKRYFFNPVTNITQWTFPEVTDSASGRQSVASASSAAVGSGEVEDDEIPYPWKKVIDSRSGRMYYFNQFTNVTQWHRPQAKKKNRRENGPSSDEAKEQSQASENGGGLSSNIAAGSSSTEGKSEAPASKSSTPASSSATRAASKSGVVSEELDSAEGEEPLPKPWLEYPDLRTGRKYFYNPETKATQWRRPTTGSVSQDSSGLSPAPVSAYNAANTIPTLSASAVSRSSAPSVSEVDSAGDPAGRDRSASKSVWKEVLDKSSQRLYYYNTETHETQWTAPTGVEYLSLDGSLARRSTVVRRLTTTGSASISDEEAKNWRQAVDRRTNRPYYFNIVTKETVWEDPRFKSAIRRNTASVQEEDDEILDESAIQSLLSTPSRSAASKEPSGSGRKSIVG